MMKKSKLIKKILLVGTLALSMALTTPVTNVLAANTSVSSELVTTEEIGQLKAKLNRCYTYVRNTYKITQDNLDKIESVYKKGLKFLDNGGCSFSELSAYEAKYEEQIQALANQNSDHAKLMISNEVAITTAKYNSDTFVVLSLINMGETNLNNVVVTPAVSTKRTEWPFVIYQATDAITLPIIPASYTVEEAYSKRMDIGWNFKVREDVLTGVYPLKFNVTYYTDEGKAGETTVTTYINIVGKDPNKTLEEKLETDKNTSQPRVVVTGFKTIPEKVYAGSVFTLKIQVQNTSSDVAIENVLFELKATVATGSGQNAESFAAFLPTSGSNSVYKERIGAGETYEIEIEMEAKADLSQKPYILNVNADYFYGDAKTGECSAEVSIPVKQEAKMDIGSVEVMPESIEVGGQSNVMFSIFNTGKTTLYNVKVVYESDSVDSGITYIGNLAPGGTGNVDSMLTGLASNEGTVNAVITYEDETGKETKVEKEITLSINENAMDEYIGMDDIYPSNNATDMPESSSGIGFLGTMLIFLGAIIAVIVIIVIVIKKRKKKSQSNLLDEDDL